MVKKRNFIIRTAGGVLLFFLAAILKTRGYAVPAFMVLLFLALTEAVLCYLSGNSLLDLRLLFSLSWLGGLALTMLDLSRLQQPFSLTMWFLCGVFYFSVNAGYEAAPYIRDAFRRRFPAEGGLRFRPRQLKAFTILVLLFVLILAAFLVESVVFDFDYPVFSDKPHAYTAFHITGIHYFVVSTPFVHALSTWILIKERPDRNRILIICAMNAVCLVIAFLILSKLQLFIGLLMSFTVWFMLKKDWTRKQALLLLIGGAAAFALISYFMIFLRKYPENYLNGIFEFRDPKTPVALQYPYMYIVNNYENLNLLTKLKTGFTWGKRILYPFYCLSGLKFLPKLADFMSVEMFHTKEELTTLTMIYDVYGDFGIAGTYVFGAVLGAVLFFVRKRSKKGRPGALLLYSQMVIYMSLSFFSCWFSNPTVWFYFALTGLITLFLKSEKPHHIKGGLR